MQTMTSAQANKMLKSLEMCIRDSNKIYCDIVSELEAGKNVAMLTSGDPSVYSTYMYIHKRVMPVSYTHLDVYKRQGRG